MAKYKLGDICEIVSGSTPRTGIDEYWDGDIKWITPAELDETSYIITDSARKITELAVKKTGLLPLPKGSVILSSRAPIGKVAIAGCEMYCNQGFKNLICSDVIINKYLYWFLKANTAFLNSLGRGATFKEISKAIVSEIEINVPSLSEQENAVANLEEISKVVTLRRQQLTLLDDLKKARFVEMFGDLLINDKQWMRLKISQICIEIVDCINKTAPTVECETEYKMLRTSNVKNGEVDISEVRYVEQKIFDKWTRRSVPQNGDVLLTREAPMGQVGLLYGVKNDVFLGQRLVSYRCDSTKMNPLFLTYQMMSRYFQDQIEKIGKGSTVKHIPVPDCTEFEVFVPPILKQNQFADFVQQVNKSKLPTSPQEGGIAC